MIFSLLLNDDTLEEMLTPEGEPWSSALPFEHPALEDCRGAAWIAPAVLRRCRRQNWIGKMSAATQQKAPESVH